MSEDICRFCGWVILRNEEFVFLYSYYDEDAEEWVEVVAHRSCLEDRARSWMYVVPENPWLKYLPPSFDLKSKEVERPKQQKLFVGKCAYCQKYVGYKDDHTYIHVRGRKRPVHSSCLNDHSLAE